MHEKITLTKGLIYEVGTYFHSIFSWGMEKMKIHLPDLQFMVKTVKDIPILFINKDQKYMKFDVTHVFTLISHKECNQDIEDHF